MCGISGIINRSDSETELKKMLSCLAHRGPENEGVWSDGVVSLGHRRLAIIDTSSGGHQPMMHPEGRFIITFNGEIYNYLELKEELQKIGHQFKTHSDTEVLLAAYKEWGEKCLDKLNGMFAFAIWDCQEEKLFAARDRLGEKPFKYCQVGTAFIFASEVKALLAYQGISREVDWMAVDEALTFRFVPSPQTGFKHIRKLPAGHYLIWQNGSLDIHCYWELPLEIKQYGLEEWRDKVWLLFKDAVAKRMQSDVPLGAFLSGGIDSTSVVAAMSELSARPIETFVISLQGESEDQKYARLAAQYFHTNHHEIALHDIDYERAITQIAEAFDEPFFDQSALPSLLISEHIKKFVTVVLSGDGGDELFGGYSSYLFARFLKRYQKLAAMTSKIVGTINPRYRYYGEVLDQSFASSYTEHYALWKTALPQSRYYVTKQDLYHSQFRKYVNESASANLMEQWFGKSGDFLNNIMAADIVGRLADGYMTKVDIATMQSAVETRPPFLDYRLVELSQQIPSSLKMKGKEQKYIWKEIVKDKIPEAVLRRPKTGFAVPLGKILMGPLKAMVEDTLLSETNLLSQNFSVSTIKRLWRDQLSGKADYSNHVWSLLILELWLRKYQVK